MGSRPTVGLASAELAISLGGYWESAVFTVPASTSEERVQFDADRWQRRFGGALEASGLTVLLMTTPEAVKQPLDTTADRRKYRLWAFVRRRPRLVTVSVPDSQVAEMQALGLKLKE